MNIKKYELQRILHSLSYHKLAESVIYSNNIMIKNLVRIAWFEAIKNNRGDILASLYYNFINRRKK